MRYGFSALRPSRARGLLPILDENASAHVRNRPDILGSATKPAAHGVISARKLPRAMSSGSHMQHGITLFKVPRRPL